MKDCQGAIITTMPTFLGLGLGKINPVKAMIQGRLKVKGLKYVLKFTKYFPLLRDH
jgi:putative sterol carrier protein